MTVQEALDLWYTPKMEKIWANESLTLDQRLTADLQLLAKVKERIRRELGYSLTPPAK
jgi:hypothetical protein